MSKPPTGKRKLTMRGGALVLRGVTLFLAAARKHRGCTSQVNNKQEGSKGEKMSNKEASKCSPKILEAIKRDTLFTRNEIETIYKIYKKLITFNELTSKGNIRQNPNTTSVIGKSGSVSEGISRAVFREVMHNTFDIVTENMLMERIFCVWDKQNYGLITLENWFHGLSLFLKGNVSKQIEYCFAVYDLNADGYITKDEMFQLLRNCLIKQPQEEDPEESVKDLVDIVMRKFDKDKDGKLSLADYRQTVEAEPLLLEAFGRCLPTEKSKITFLITLKS